MISQHSVKNFFTSPVYNQSCENNVSLKMVTVQFCKGQLPLHLTVGCHKTYDTEEKFKYIARN